MATEGCLAEADGNRTRQTELLGLVGFEDRGAHQDTYASELTSNPHAEPINPPEGGRPHNHRSPTVNAAREMLLSPRRLTGQAANDESARVKVRR